MGAKFLQAKGDSKILWKVIREILGKTKSKEEQIYLYRKDMARHKAQDAWKYFLEEWRKDIYQKTPRMTHDFWYGTKDHIGLK